MIGYIQGTVMECADGRLLLSVGYAEGALGYAVTVPQSPAYLSVQTGGRAELFIYTHVREDALDLYGFQTRLEKELFLSLLSVNGIGPKVALGVISGAAPAQIIRAILAGDKEFLTQIPGIGKKTAERVVLELADALRKKVDAGWLADGSSGAQDGARTAQTRAEPAGAGSLIHDAREALVGLGYKESVVSALLNRVASEMQPPPARAEELIRSALRQLG